MGLTTRLLGSALATLGGFALAASLAWAEPAVRSGQYGPFALIVANGMVRGLFSAERGEPWVPGAHPGAGPSFSCAFLLQGHLDGSRAKVITWTPGDTTTIAGVLTFTGNGIALQLQKDQPGCVTTYGEMVHAAAEEEFVEPAQGWIGVALVKAHRTVLQPTPTSSARTKPALVQGDPVAILERQSNWVKVNFLGGEKPQIGWIRRGDLTSDAPLPTDRTGKI